MKRWRHRGLLAALLLGPLLLSGCAGGKGAPLPEGMDWGALLAQGEQVVEQLAAQDYQGAYDRLRADVQAGLTVEDIAAIMDPVLEQAGTFERFTETSARGDSKVEPLGVADILCAFSEEKVRFLVVFDPEMELTGFSVEVQSKDWSLSNIWDNLTGLFK